METNILFRKPYVYEGKKYDGIDLAGLRKLRTADLLAAQVEVGRVARDRMDSTAYLNVLASMATEKPRGFFGGIAGRDAFFVPKKVKAVIADIEDEEAQRDGLRIQFKHPGALGKKMDLSRLNEMTAEEFAQAEDMVGFMEWSAANDVVNIQYACAVAAVALCPERPEEQLQKLMDAPFWVGSFVQDAVQGFFGQADSEEAEKENPSETTC